jgi:exosome complex component RRP41
MMKRLGNRKPGETRPVTIKAGVIEQADGSALFSFGKTTAVAAVYGPHTMHPKHRQLSNRAVLRTTYSMLPFSTTERVRPGPSRRSTEICKVTRHALEPALFLEELPKASIDVYINITQADAGTRTAGINAASVALADAGISMRDLVAAVAVGKVDGEYFMDLEGKEEDESLCDLPIAYMPRTGQLTLMQMDGNLPPKEVKDLINFAIKGCEEIYRKQKQALRERWEVK